MLAPGTASLLEGIDLGSARRGAGLVLRKEVIQPQVPLRLPCYDFVPLTGHTFDASLSYELGQRLRVQQTQVT